MRLNEIEPMFKELEKRIDQLDFALLNHAICPKCGNYPIKQKITPQEVNDHLKIITSEGAKYTCSKCGYIHWIALKEKESELKNESS